MSKKNTVYFSFSLLLLLVLVMPACEWFKPKSEAADQAKQEAVQEPKLRLLDADSVEVYNDAHIPGAVNVSADTIEGLSEKWNKETPVVVYCSSYDCTASHQVAKNLAGRGFKNVAVYTGGINEWVNLSKEKKEEYPVEGEAKQDFLQKKIAAPTTAPKEEEGIRVISAEELSKQLKA